jgi:hypothetical protein
METTKFNPASISRHPEVLLYSPLDERIDAGERAAESRSVRRFVPWEDHTPSYSHPIALGRSNRPPDECTYIPGTQALSQADS